MASEERRRLTEAEGRALVRRWRQSEDTKAEFCRRTGVGIHVLRYWIEREAQGSEPTDVSHSDFVVVSAPREPKRVRSEPSEHGPVRGARAVLVVVSEASSSLLAQTVRELLDEVRQ